MLFMGIGIGFNTKYGTKISNIHFESIYGSLKVTRSKIALTGSL